MDKHITAGVGGANKMLCIALLYTGAIVEARSRYKT